MPLSISFTRISFSLLPASDADVGNYSPDWAIAFNEGTVKHIYFVAETKGSLDTLQLRAIEKAKIDCAKALYNKMSDSKVRYEHVTSYTDLLNKINNI